MRKLNEFGKELVEKGVSLMIAGDKKTLREGEIVYRLKDKETCIIITKKWKFVIQKGNIKHEAYRNVHEYPFCLYSRKKLGFPVWKSVYERIEMFVKMTLIKHKH